MCPIKLAIQQSSHLDRATHNVVSRLLACIVNEKLGQGTVHQHRKESPTEFAFDQNGVANGAEVPLGQINIGSLRIVFPLNGTPLLAPPTNSKTESAAEVWEIALIYHDEIGWPVYATKDENGIWKGGSSGSQQLIQEILSELAKQDMCGGHSVEEQRIKQMYLELQSSIEHQAYAYARAEANGFEPPNISKASAIDWEQSMVEGNPMHPMHKTRFGVLPPHLAGPFPVAQAEELVKPMIQFFAVPRAVTELGGNYQSVMETLATQLFPYLNVNEEIIVPVHQVQLPIMKTYFPFARPLGVSVAALAQSSTRTMVIPTASHLNLKLPLGLIISSWPRGICTKDIHYLDLKEEVIHRVIEDKQLLLFAKELGGVVVFPVTPTPTVDNLVQNYMACIIREDPSHVAPPSEKVIVCGALAEGNNMEAFNLTEPEARKEFFREYVRLYFRVFLPPVFKYGFTFEPHAQNVLARFSQETKESRWKLTGFVIRDLSDCRLNRQRFEATTGLCVKAADLFHVDWELDRIYKALYAWMFHFHLRGIARALELHGDGSAWRIVRTELNQLLPLEDCGLRRVWLEQDEGFVMTSIKRKLFENYNGNRFSQVANLITYAFDKNFNVKSDEPNLKGLINL